MLIDDEDDDIHDYSDWDEPDEDTMPCPYCQAQIFEDAVSCPACGNYLSEEDVPTRERPWWVIVGLIAALVVALSWAFWG